MEILPEVRRGPAVEPRDELEGEFLGLPRRVGEHEAREEPGEVRGDLGHEGLRAEEGLRDPPGLLPARELVQVALGVEVDVKEYKKKRVPVQLRVRLPDPHEG